jgi:GT2 family glycosyltransferase
MPEGSPLPLLSAVMLPDGLVASSAARDSVETVLRQRYPRWELWLPADLRGGWDDERLRLLEPGRAEGVAAWFGRVLERAAGDYLVPIPPYAQLSPAALHDIAAAAAATDDAPDLIYGDEDLFDEVGSVVAQCLKPAWDPELMLGRNSVGHLSAYRAARVRAVGGPEQRWPASEAFLYDLALRVGGQADSGPVRHVASVLGSTPFAIREARLLDGGTAREIVAAHLERLGERDATVVAAPRDAHWNRVTWPLPSPLPRVSVIVPTRDQPTMLSRCAEGVLARTDYPDLELLVIDNGSADPDALSLMAQLGKDPRVRIIRHDAAFNFSALNNLAVRQATGSIVVLLNDDTEVISSDWLRELASQASRPSVGLVGARLLYPDHRVQHAGIVTGQGGALHQFRFCDASDPGPNGELALCRSVMGVTGACVALRRSVFEEVGGMDEDLTVAYGDVDLGFRVASHGYRVICSPFAELFHHESATRGYEDTPAKQARHEEELERLRARWPAQLWSDRFANPAHLRECGGASFVVA